MSDPVNSPAHYTTGKVECIDAIESALSPEEFKGYLRGNAIKYLWRYRHKGGLEDLKKANWYLARLVRVENGPELVEVVAANAILGAFGAL